MARIATVGWLFMGAFGGVGLGSKAASGATPTVSDPKTLLPRPLVLEQKLTGDLDRDGDLDAILVGVDGPAKLEEITPGGSDGNRVLVVARKTQGAYVLAGIGFGALLCRTCGGAFWGVNPAPVELSVAKGVLTVSQSAGSRQVTDWVHRYRIENGKVRLIGLDRTVTDRLNGAVVIESTNYLTGTKITTVEGEPEDPVKAGTRKGRPATVLLAKVTIE